MYFELFLVFFRIGAVTFGGGYAMLPLIEEEVVNKKKWIKTQDILNIFAVAQSVPGAVAINTATIIGYKMKGKFGALMSTLGVITPSFIIILIVAKFFSTINELAIVDSTFIGINGAVVALILIAAVKMIKSSVKNLFHILIFITSICLIIFAKINPVYIIFGSIIVGLISGLIKGDDEIC